MKRFIILMILIAAAGLAMGMRATGSATSQAVVISTLYPPMNLTGAYDGSSLEFFWDEPLTGPALSYNLYYSETPQDLGSYLILDEAATNYYITDAYYENVGFYVTAIYSLGESRRSNVFTRPGCSRCECSF